MMFNKYILAFFLIFSLQNILWAGYEIKINIPSCLLELYKDGQYYKEYPVGVGSSRISITPLGDFEITRKVKNPIWEHPHKPIGQVRVGNSPYNPLGKYWLEFHSNKTGAFGIHGTNEPKSVGSFVSHGCIRMHNEDIVELFNMIDIGTPVYITYQRYAIIERGDKIYLLIYPDPYNKGLLPSFENIYEDIVLAYPDKNIELYQDKIEESLKIPVKTTAKYWIGTVNYDSSDSSL